MNVIARRMATLSVASTAFLIRVSPAVADVALEPTLPEKANEIIQNAGDTPAADAVWPIVVLGIVAMIVLVAAGALILWGVMRIRRSKESGSSPTEGSE